MNKNRKFNEMVTKVRVVSAEKESYWYANRIGEEFDVLDEKWSKFNYIVKHEEHGWHLIGKNDAEPVEIRYNGKRYRLESRKAEADEKVVVIANKSGHHFNTGDIVSVTNVWDKGTREEHIDAVNTDGEEWSMGDAEYRVLVPVTESSVSTTQETADNSDKIIEMLTALSTEVAKLKREVQTLKGREITVDAPKITIDTSVTVEEVAERIKKALEPLLGRKLTSPFTLTASCDTDGISIKTEVSKPLTRADVVKRAQADVEALKADMANVANPHLRDRKDVYLVGSIAHTAEFIINREKRTVVCLLRYAVFPESVNHRGIAKCAPDDVFNADIGKAIALRRALNLSVPDEYLNAPKPKGVAVGDVVIDESSRYSGKVWAVSPRKRTYNEIDSYVDFTEIEGWEDGITFITKDMLPNRDEYEFWTFKEYVKVIDDSDREEYRKGACC